MAMVKVRSARIWSLPPTDLECFRALGLRWFEGVRVLKVQWRGCYGHPSQSAWDGVLGLGFIQAVGV